jgi:cyclophilin family peptidyl-prolyl cis-trans isomerase
VALRRAVPVVNEATGRVQKSLENLLFLLRIPQRKPWGDMAAAVAASQASLVADRDGMLAAVPAAQRDAAAATLATLAAKIDSLSNAVSAQDADVTALRATAALAEIAKLEIAQAPGLPYLLPSAYASLPRLAGRATVELLVQRPGGATFPALSNGAGPQSTGRLLIELDGYNAPLTAGNFAALAARGYFDGAPLSGTASDETVFALPSGPPPLARTLPLEVRAEGEYEPRYRAPLDVLGSGELPVLPLSVYGAVAMARGPEGNDSDGGNFFFFRFARATAGLGGAAFEEGSFAVCGYVIDGVDLLRELRTGDSIRTARLIAGQERLVMPQAAGGGAAPAVAVPLS